MMHSLLTGAVAGAAGTVALDATSFADMALRGRAASAAPATLVQKLAERAHLGGLADPDAGEAVRNRRAGLGSLAGIGVGLGVGAIYGLIRQPLRNRVPLFLAAAAAGGAALAMSDVPLARLGVSDPSQWSAADWLSDIIPHAAYGLAVAVVFEAFMP